MVTSTRYMYYMYICAYHTCIYMQMTYCMQGHASMNTGKIYEGLYTSVKVEAHSNKLKSCVWCYLHVGIYITETGLGLVGIIKSVCIILIMHTSLVPITSLLPLTETVWPTKLGLWAEQHISLVLTTFWGISPRHLSSQPRPSERGEEWQSGHEAKCTPMCTLWVLNVRSCDHLQTWRVYSTNHHRKEAVHIPTLTCIDFCSDCLSPFLSFYCQASQFILSSYITPLW